MSLEYGLEGIERSWSPLDERSLDRRRSQDMIGKREGERERERGRVYVFKKVRSS